MAARDELVERHGHLQLVPEVRSRLLAMSAVTIHGLDQDRQYRP